MVRCFLEEQLESTSGLCATRIVEAMVTTPSEKREVRRALVELYSEADDDGDGKISFKEFKKVFRSGKEKEAAPRDHAKHAPL